jgi:hypothetical protein
MTGAMIAQLLITYGPTAVNLIEQLIQTWDKPMTVEQVHAVCALTKKTYDEGLAEAKARLAALIAPPAIAALPSPA